jgi:uncharacterized iron-regulated membrane protein
VSILGRVRTVGALLRHFLHRGRWFLLPLLVVLLLGGVLLALTGGLAYVTPFLYALF